MKNFAIKKVALGLLLAGYAASGAFALSATTAGTIHGRAPVINAKSVTASTTASSVDVEVYHGTTKLTSTDTWAVGDRVKLIFKANDADGDTDVLLTGNTVSFLYKKSGNWTTSTVAATARAGTSSDDGASLTGYQVVEWYIPAEVVNATNIGFNIQPTTEFGAPDKNNWLAVDISSSGAIGDSGNSTTPGTPEGGGTGGGTTGGGTDGSTPVAPGDSFGLKIVALTSAGSVTVGSEYQAANGDVVAGTGTGDITLTDQYEVRVFSAGVDVTADAGYSNYEWYVTGGNSAANGSVANAADNVYFVGTNAKNYTLPATNAVTLTEATAAQNQGIQGNTTAGAATALPATNNAEAGLQGFKLGVYVHD